MSISAVPDETFTSIGAEGSFGKIAPRFQTVQLINRDYMSVYQNVLTAFQLPIHTASRSIRIFVRPTKDRARPAGGRIAPALGGGSGAIRG